jgi:protein-tyrosine kinase
MTIIERAMQAARAKSAKQPAAPPPAAPSVARVAPVTGPADDAPGQTVVGFIKRRSGTGPITQAADRGIYEQFRRLKRPLLQCAFGPLAEPGAQIIMVTSPLQGAGKTFVSGNLAHVLAMEKDREVLLVDTDNANPTLSRQLGLLGKPGLYDILNDSSIALRDAILKTDLPGLYVLPAGGTATDSLERLNSARCRDAMTEILTTHPGAIIILDSPPLLMTNEAPAVAALAGQYLLIIEAGVTPRSAVSKSVELLDQQKPIGLILNKAPGFGDLGSYYYYYAAHSGQD